MKQTLISSAMVVSLVFSACAAEGPDALPEGADATADDETDEAAARRQLVGTNCTIEDSGKTLSAVYIDAAGKCAGAAMVGLAVGGGGGLLLGCLLGAGGSLATDAFKLGATLRCDGGKSYQVVGCNRSARAEMVRRINRSCPQFIAGGEVCSKQGTGCRTAYAQRTLGTACERAEINYLTFCGGDREDWRKYRSVQREANACRALARRCEAR